MDKKATKKSRTILKSKRLGRENKKKRQKKVFFCTFFYILQHTGVLNLYGLLGHLLYQNISE